MAKNSTTDIELLAGLNIDSSEQEILRAIKIIQKRIKANTDARFKLNVEIDETVINDTIAKLQNALKNKDLKIETQDSIVAITKEANAMLEVVEAAKRASQEKLDFAKANERVRNSADDTADAINRERTAMNNLDDLDSILQNVNMTGRQGASVFQKFGRSLHDAVATYTTVNLLEKSIDKFIEAGKEGIEIVKGLNDSLTSLRMATGESYKSVNNLLQTYNEMAQELGVITNSVANASDAFLRQGLTVKETNELVKDSIMLSQIANIDSADSTKYLTSIMNSYELAVEDVITALNALVQVDLNSASDAGGLALSMSRSASAAKMAGVEMNKLIAMIATVSETTQDSPEAVGNMFKSIFSRMNQIRAGKFTDLENGEALNDVEKVLNGLGIATRDMNNQMIDSGKILDIMGEKWNTYDSNAKKALATATAGTYQYNKFLALMDNYPSVLEYTKIAENSDGAAEEKFGYYLESLEAKTNSLKASLENLADSTISDELYGSVLDTTKAIVDMITESGILKSALIGISTAGAVYTSQHLTAYLREATQEFANLGEAMQITRGANGTITDIQRLIDLTGGLSESQTRLLLSSRNLTDAQRTAILVNQYLAQGMDDDLARATAEATLNTWGLATAQNGATGATITLRNTLQGLWSTLMANPLVAVTVAVTAAATAFNSYKQKQEEVIRVTEEAARESAELSDELNDLTAKYLSLSDAVNDDESAKEDLLDVQEQLIKKMGLESDELDNLIEKYGILDEKVQNYIKNEAIAKLQEARHDLISGYGTAKDKLIAESDSMYGNQWTVFSKENKEALKVLEKKGIGRVTDEYVGDRFYLTGIDDTVEGAINNFNQLKDALSALEEEYGADNVKDIGLYNDLYKRYLELKPVIESYMESVDDLNENAASSLQFTMLKDIELPDTEEEIKSFRDQLLNAALASDDFVGTQEDIERAVNSVMKTFSSYSKEDISGISDDNVLTGLLSDKQKESIEEYKALMKKIAEIRENPDSYSLSDLTTEFTSYDWSKFSDGAESLDTALQKIAGGSLDDVRTGLEGFSNAEPILEELSGLFAKTFQLNDFGWSENLGHYDFLSNLLKEVQDGKKFNKDEITKILDDYDLYGDIKELENGFTIDTDALISLINKYAEEHNESLQKVREVLESSGIDPDSILGKNSYKELIDTGSSRNDSYKDFSDSIDWASQSISNLEDKVSDLETILDNTKGWEAQIEAIDNVNGALSDLQTGYENSATTYHDKYEEILNGIADEDVRNAVRDSIENGTRFDYELYAGVDEEKLFDSINEATDMYNKSEDAKNNAIEIGFRIKGNDLEKHNIELDHLSTSLDLVQTKFDNSDSLKDKMSLSKELISATEEYYDKEIEIAELNEDIVKSDELRLKKAEALFKVEKDLLLLKKDERTSKRNLAQTRLDTNTGSLEDRKALYKELRGAALNEKMAEIDLAEAEGNAEEAERLFLLMGKEHKDLLSQEAQEYIDYYSSLMSKSENKLELPISDENRLAVLEELSEQTEEYYDRKIEDARLYNNIVEAENLELEKAKALNDIKQEEIDLARELNEFVLSQLDYQKQLIQNQIDLNGGKGNAEQYSKLISVENDILAERNSEHEQELAMLNQIALEVGVNSSEYREQLEVVQSIETETDACTKRIKEWQIELLRLPLDEIAKSINDLNDKLEKVQDRQSKMDIVISGAQAYIQDQIDSQEEIKNGLQDQLDILQKTNDERERANALEKAKYELARAMSQRTVKMYSGVGKGFIYTPNQDDVRSAQENLSKFEFEETVHQLEKQIEYYEDIISNLQEIKDAWGNVANEAQDVLNIQEALKTLSVDDIFNINMVDEKTDAYTKLLGQQEDIQGAIDIWEEFKESIEETIEKFEYGTTTFEECFIELERLVTEYFQNDTSIEDSEEKIKTCLDTIKDKYFKEYLEKVDKTGDDVSDALDPDTDPTKKTLKELKTELDTYKAEVEKKFSDMYETINAKLLLSLESFSKNVEASCGKLKEEIEGTLTSPTGSVTSDKSSGTYLSGIVDKVVKAQEQGSVLKKANVYDYSETPLITEKVGISPEVQAAFNAVDFSNITGMNYTPVSKLRPTTDSATNLNKVNETKTLTTPVTQDITISLPNVTNENGYNNLVRELKQLPSKAIQFSTKR